MSENLEETKSSLANHTNDNFENKTEEQIPENNGLENFELSEEETPELFNSDMNDEVLSTQEEINSEEEDLEIPAFLRRQKN